MWTTLDGTAKALTRDNAALTNDVETLTSDLAASSEKVETLTSDLDASKEENESLRALLADSAGGKEFEALAAGAKAANVARRVPLAAVKREGEGGGREKRASKRTRK